MGRAKSAILAAQLVGVAELMPMSDMITPFGKLCSDGRAYMTMTRPELAKLINTTPKDISDIETGKKEPSGLYVSLVAGILGLDLQELEMSLSTADSQYRFTRVTQSNYGA